MIMGFILRNFKVEKLIVEEIEGFNIFVWGLIYIFKKD